MTENTRTSEKIKIASVVIAYNNQNTIEKLLSSLFSQTYPIEEIIVIDNASSDDAVQMIQEKFHQVTLFANVSNVGAGGGYAMGMEYAHKKNYDWVWLLDGDSLPEIQALEKLINAFAYLTRLYSKIGILASSPINPLTGLRENGILWKDRFVKLPKKIRESQNPFLVDTVITSGSLINNKVIDDIGLPRFDFFIDFVDHEYNLRARKMDYKIIYVPDSVIHHEIGHTKIVKLLQKKGNSAIHPPWRLYYMVRNELYTYLHEFRNYKALTLFFVLKLTKIIFKIIQYNHPEKTQRFKYIILGCRDGFKCRLGKVYGPEDR